MRPCRLRRRLLDQRIVSLRPDRNNADASKFGATTVQSIDRQNPLPFAALGVLPFKSNHTSQIGWGAAADGGCP